MSLHTLNFLICNMGNSFRLYKCVRLCVWVCDVCRVCACARMCARMCARVCARVYNLHHSFLVYLRPLDDTRRTGYI